MSCAHLQCAPGNQEKPTGLASQHQTLQSPQQLSPMQRDHSLSNEERREFVSSCSNQKHQRCGLSDSCQPLPDDRCHTPAKSRPKHPEVSIPRKRTCNPLLSCRHPTLFHAIPLRPRVVHTKPEIQHEFVERTRSFSVCTRSDFRQRDSSISNKTTIFEAIQTDVAIITQNNKVAEEKQTWKRSRQHVISWSVSL